MTLRYQLLVSLLLAQGVEGHDRVGLWVDLYQGEPVTFEEMMEDLIQVDVIYIGERHTVSRHHQWQQRVVEGLLDGGRKVLLGLEQMEAPYQPILDRYNRGEITYDELASQTAWTERWGNAADYRSVVELVQRRGGRVVALNARAELVKEVGRKGLDGLSPDQRRQLPKTLMLDSDEHRRYVSLQVQVHAHMEPALLESIYQAQVARDETMAASLAAALRDAAGDRPAAVVLCGAGHSSHGLGIPQRLRVRLPDLKDRILHLTASGDVEITPKMRAVMKDVEITHRDLRFLTRPLADYLHVIEPRPDEPAR